MQAKHLEDIEAADEQRAKLEAQTTEVDHKKQALIDELTKKWDPANAEYDKLAAEFLKTQTAQTQLIAQRGLLANQAAAARPQEPERDKDGNPEPGEAYRYNSEKRQYDQLAPPGQHRRSGNSSGCYRTAVPLERGRGRGRPPGSIASGRRKARSGILAQRASIREAGSQVESR